MHQVETSEIYLRSLPRKSLPHRDMASRLQQACLKNPSVPEPNHGRLKWFVERLGERGVGVQQETVRKWLAGETRPRDKAMPALAKILGVDLAWLSVGTEAVATPAQGQKVQPSNIFRATRTTGGESGMADFCAVVNGEVFLFTVPEGLLN